MEVFKQFEKAGFALLIYDKSQKGFDKIYHFVQRLHVRGISPKDALDALSRGSQWYDTKRGSIAHVLGENVDGTAKIIVENGIIKTGVTDKLTKKFKPL
jgi:hypothetical protein